MSSKICVAVLCAAAFAVSTAIPSTALAQSDKARAAKKAPKRYGPVPVTMDPPRTRVTVRRSYLDAGTYVLPGDRKFTDYAIPPGYSPTSVIDHRVGVHRSPLPGPFDLPGRDNPWPWNYCINC